MRGGDVSPVNAEPLPPAAASIAVGRPGSPGNRPVAGRSSGPSPAPHDRPQTEICVKVTRQRAQQIESGECSPWEELLGFDFDKVEAGTYDDGVVRTMVGLFLEQWSRMETRYAGYKSYRADFPGFGLWLAELSTLMSSPSPRADMLDRMREARHARNIGILVTHAGVHLQDEFLELSEHGKMLELASQLGLTEQDVENAYRQARPGGFRRESRGEPLPAVQPATSSAAQVGVSSDTRSVGAPSRSSLSSPDSWFGHPTGEAGGAFEPPVVPALVSSPASLPGAAAGPASPTKTGRFARPRRWAIALGVGAIALVAVVVVSAAAYWNTGTKVMRDAAPGGAGATAAPIPALDVVVGLVDVDAAKLPAGLARGTDWMVRLSAGRRTEIRSVRVLGGTRMAAETAEASSFSITEEAPLRIAILLGGDVYGEAVFDWGRLSSAAPGTRPKSDLLVAGQVGGSVSLSFGVVGRR